jgi:hypothetical protein
MELEASDHQRLAVVGPALLVPERTEEPNLVGRVVLRNQELHLLADPVDDRKGIEQ